MKRLSKMRGFVNRHAFATSVGATLVLVSVGAYHLKKDSVILTETISLDGQDYCEVVVIEDRPWWTNNQSNTDLEINLYDPKGLVRVEG